MRGPPSARPSRMSASSPAEVLGRARSLLLAGDDTDRRAARKTLSKTALAALAGRELPAHASREQAVHPAELARLALALGQARCQLKDNRAQLLAIAR